ncbi:MAG: hypothetical protein E7507_04955 [Ruminococcus sp.]|nr:hypothetical protein [Ruminococcus sp.]
MDIEKICEFFELISGADSEENMLFVEAAEEETLRLLKDPRCASLSCVERLAGAIANFYYCSAMLTKEVRAVNLGGGVTSTYPDNSRVENAKLLVAQEKKLCSDYIIDEDFVFFGTRG